MSLKTMTPERLEMLCEAVEFAAKHELQVPSYMAAELLDELDRLRQAIKGHRETLVVWTRHGVVSAAQVEAALADLDRRLGKDGTR
jgi:hypothetical protein